MANAETREDQFTDTPEGWARRLTREFEAARKVLKPWHEQAEAAITEYLDERDSNQTGVTKWNVYTADTQTKEAILFGNPPRADVRRTFNDAQDDVARVGGEILERILNSDIEDDDDSFSLAISYAHQDRELTGFGLCRVRYEMGETEEKEGQPAIEPMTGPDGMARGGAPEVPAVTLRPNEEAATDWIHWKDCLWNPCRVWHELGWLSFRAQMTIKEIVAKFGQEAEDVPLNSKKGAGPDKEGKNADPWGRADVWECWVKDGKQVFFFVEGYPRVLKPVAVPSNANGGVPDPLGLPGFWPCPRPMLANVTTSKLVPKPDRELAKDLYREVNILATRLTMLRKALKVRGIYDKKQTAIGQILDGEENEMIPADNWAMTAEAGGLRGVMDFYPIEQVAKTVQILDGQMAGQLDMLRQITGMADIMRGQAMGDGTTATETRVTARFGSVRMEKRQKELARFASDLQNLRAQVMALHFADSTLLARSNCQNTPDAPLAMSAVQFIKSDVSKYRIEVKPEVISMTDFDALKQERTEVIGAISQYLTAAAPLAQAMPGSMPMLLEVLQWMISGLRGAAEIEGVLDRAIAQSKQAAAQPQQQQQDPKMQTEQLKAQTQQMKGQFDLQKEQMKHQNKLQELQAETVAHDQQEQSQANWNTREALQKGLIQKSLRPDPMAPKPGGFP